MVSTISLSQIEEMIEQLSRQERLLLIERLAHQLREEVNGGVGQSPGADEQVIALLQQDIRETPAERGARMLQVSADEQAQITAAWDEVMQKLGISGEPIGAEKLRARIEAGGIKPEDNEFSRGIIEMREE